MVFGILDTKYIDFPDNVDQAYLRGLTTAAGLKFPDILREIDARLGAFNGTLDPLVADLITPTTEAYAEGSAPQAFSVQRRAEYTPARPQLVEGAAHMLPLAGFENALGFTEDGLKRMSMNRIILNVESALLGWRVKHKREVLRRLFSDGEFVVAANTTSVSPGFAGSGTGTNAFNRGYPDGTALPGGYTHYYAANTSTGGALRATLKNAVERLKKWQRPPFDLIAPAAKIDEIIALGSPDYIAAGSELVRLGTGTAEALVDASLYAGVLFGEVRVRYPITDTSASVIAIFKTQGDRSPLNPLAWRWDEIEGRGASLRYREAYPLHAAYLRQDFGVGVNNRVAAALIYAASGAASYTAPTDLDDAA